MSEPTNNLVQHLDPNRDSFNMAGIALIADDHNPKDVIDFYHKTGRLPDIHPAVLYEVKKRGTEGDKLNRTHISLEDGRVLEVVGDYISQVWQMNKPSEARSEHFELARRTLEQMGSLGYQSTAITPSGTKITMPVDVSGQIESLLVHHLATQANPDRTRES